MAVTSKPMPDRAPQRQRSTPSASAGCLAVLGVFMLLVSVGPLIVLINGGYSIIGMAWLAEHIGPYGRLFWSVASFYTIDVPIARRAGLPLAQPVLPWIMVVGMSSLEVGLLLYRLRSLRPGAWIAGGGAAVSIFDYVTTSAGLMFAPFTDNLSFSLWAIWAAVALLLAIPITFGFEGLLARVLKGA